jgi:hypothetical protein
VPFQIVHREGKKSAIIKLTIAGNTSPELLAALSRTLDYWLIACAWYPSLTLAGKGDALGAKMGLTDTQLTANIAGWDYASKPIRAALINTLIRFHHDVVAIQKLELTLPP